MQPDRFFLCQSGDAAVFHRGVARLEWGDLQTEGAGEPLEGYFEMRLVLGVVVMLPVVFLDFVRDDVISRFSKQMKVDCAFVVRLWECACI